MFRRDFIRGVGAAFSGLAGLAASRRDRRRDPADYNVPPPPVEHRATRDAGGRVTAISLVHPGRGYTSAPSVAISSGAGGGAAACPTLDIRGRAGGRP